MPVSCTFANNSVQEQAVSSRSYLHSVSSADINLETASAEDLHLGRPELRRRLILRRSTQPDKIQEPRAVQEPKDLNIRQVTKIHGSKQLRLNRLY